MSIKSSNIHIILLILAIFSSIALRAEEKSLRLRTVVIDAGHGGKDPGTIMGKTYEKNITLPVALELGRIIKKEHPDVRVIFTRKDDTFIGLHQRADIANKNNADLFISIHINSVGNPKIGGVETFVMGTEKNASNMEVCKRENSVITLEEDYSTNYSGFDPRNPESYIIFSLLQNAHIEQSMMLAELVQNQLISGPVRRNRGVKQAPYLVLWKCTMPSILIELGFLTSPTDFKSLTDKNSQKVMAQKIADAFTQYKKKYDRTLNTDARPSGSGEIQGPARSGGYQIQILASRKLLPADSRELKGYPRKYIRSGEFYKYVVGPYSSRSEAEAALKTVRKNFKDAYIIKAK